MIWALISLLPTAVLAKTAAQAGSDMASGLLYEAYMSPWQEPDEESKTPKATPPMFRSTEPSQTRAERAKAGHRGYGSIHFSNDLSKAVVRVQIENINLTKINMFHIHCGLPGILGPILVDFSLMTNITENFQDDGTFQVTVTNKDIEQARDLGEGQGVAGFAQGCIIPSPSLTMLSPDPKDRRPVKVSTVAGMAEIAETRHLYFNLHTKAQTFYGDIRGQIWPAAHLSRIMHRDSVEEEDDSGAKAMGASALLISLLLGSMAMLS